MIFFSISESWFKSPLQESAQINQINQSVNQTNQINLNQLINKTINQSINKPFAIASDLYFPTSQIVLVDYLFIDVCARGKETGGGGGIVFSFLFIT